MLKNPPTLCKDLGTEFPVLWSCLYGTAVIGSCCCGNPARKTGDANKSEFKSISHVLFMSLQSLGPVGLRGIIEVISTNVTCFPAMRVVPPALVILGVRHAYQPKSKQQKKDNIVPSHRIGVTQSWDSQHTGMESF